jgi:hypothetical protein
MLTRLLPLAFLGLPCQLAAQTTVQFSATKDNTLYEHATGSLSNGAGSHLFVGRSGDGVVHRTLIAFDVSSIPAGARVLAVELTLSMSRTVVAANVPVAVHRVQANWGQGASNASGQEGRGAPAAANDATWVHRYYPGSPWTTLGGDFAASPSAVTATTLDPTSVFGSSGMAADVQAWLDTPATNFGWLLKTVDESLLYYTRRFDSRENTTVAFRPVLRVTWMLPGTTAVVGQGCVGSGSQPFALSIAGVPSGGNTLQLLHAAGQPGSAAVNLIGLGLASPGLPVYPSCELRLDLGLPIVTHNLVVLDGGGASSSPLPVPPGFAGFFLAVQAAALDSGLAAGFVLSNAALALVQ